MIAMSKKKNRSRVLRSATSAVIEQIEPRIFLTATQTPFVAGPGYGIENTGPYSTYMADGEADPGAASPRAYSEFGYVSIPISSFSPTYTVSTANATAEVTNLQVALDNSATSGKYGPTAGTFDVYVLQDNDTNNGGPATLTQNNLVYGQPGDPVGSTNGGLLALGSNFGSTTSSSLNVTGAPTAGNTSSNGNYVGSYTVSTGLALGYTTYSFSNLSTTVQSIIASDFNSSQYGKHAYRVGNRSGDESGDHHNRPGTADPSAFVDYYGQQANETPTLSLNLNETPLPSVNENFATSFPAVNVNEVNTNKTVEIDVTRSGYTADSATVTYSTANGAGSNGAVAGTNYTATSGTLTFGANVTQQEIAVPITEVGTTGFAETKNFTVSLGTATPAPIAWSDDHEVGVGHAEDRHDRWRAWFACRLVGCSCGHRNRHRSTWWSVLHDGRPREWFGPVTGLETSPTSPLKYSSSTALPPPISTPRPEQR